MLHSATCTRTSNPNPQSRALQVATDAVRMASTLCQEVQGQLMRQDEQAVTKDDKSLVTLADYAAQVGIWLGAQRLGSRAWCHQGKNRWQVPDHACRRRSGWMGGGDDINQRPGRPPDTGAPCAACRFGFRNTFMRVIPKTCLVRPPWSYGSKCAGRGSVGIQLAPFGDLDTAGALWGSLAETRPLNLQRVAYTPTARAAPSPSTRKGRKILSC